MMSAFAGSYSDANVVVAADWKRLKPNRTAVFPSPVRSYTAETRGDQFFQIGIWMSANAGMLAKRPDCAGCPSTCSLTYSHRRA